MRKLVVTNIMSLDGYYDGPGGNVMVMPMDEAFDAYNLERIRAADTLLLGATSYRGFKGFWPPLSDDPEANPVHRAFARLDNAIDKVVVSDSLTEDETDPWRSTTRIVRRADAHDAVDELHLILGPAVVGGGTPLFGTRPPGPLRLAEVRRFDGSDNLLVRYEVAGR